MECWLPTFFYRWHVDREAFPDFTTSERWFPIKLLKTGKDPTKEMSYKVHRAAVTAALESVGIHRPKPTSVEDQAHAWQT